MKINWNFFSSKTSAICFSIVGVCALLNFFMFIYFQNHIAFVPTVSIISAFMGSAISVFIFETWAREEKEQAISKKMKKDIKISIDEALNIRSVGIKDSHIRFENSQFIKMAEDCKKIFILQTYAPNETDIHSALLTAMDNGTDIRVALLHPSSRFVPIRAAETPVNHPKPEEFPSRIENNISRLKHCASQRKGEGKMFLGLYNRSPGVCIYSTDKTMLVSAFLTDKDAISSPQVELDSNSHGYNIFLDHFENVWQSCEIEEL